jgi:hypothetical protein
MEIVGKFGVDSIKNGCLAMVLNTIAANTPLSAVLEKEKAK